MSFCACPDCVNEPKHCDCDSCREMHHFFEIIRDLSDQDQEWMMKFYEKVDNERLDAGVNQAIIDGSWPTADEQIKYARQGRAENNNENNNVNNERQT